MADDHAAYVAADHDRLTRMADAALEAVLTHPEYPEGEVWTMVLIHDRETVGTGLHGYEDGRAVLLDVLAHAHWLAEAEGVGLQILPLRRRGHG